MRVVLALCLAIALAHAREADYKPQFQAFKKQFGRTYSSHEEEARRYRIFVSNLEHAAKLQSANPLATFGVNEFADMSAAEFKVRHNSEKFYEQMKKENFPTQKMPATAKQAAAGQQQDWRPKGAVTPIKNQGQCGSCWAFSTTGGIEGQWFLAGNTLTSLSEQELVSCDTIDSGCNGGLMDNAFTWLLQSHNGSIVTEASYPYVSGNGNVPACSMSGTQFGARIHGFKNIGGTEPDMAAFVSKGGPPSIAVDAESWQLYMGGIMTNCVAGQLDHGVLAVGFDTTNNPPYWIIKNSWGASWGEEGYIRVQYGTGQCSLGQYQTTALVSGGPKPTPTPTPPSPPGPTPPPSGPQFVQKTCLDNTCSSRCSEQAFPAGECVARATGSFVATCATDAVIVASYTTTNCTGAAVYTANPIDTCSIVFQKDGSEHFVLNECRGNPTRPPITPRPQPPAPTPAPTAAPTPAPSATFTQMQCTDSACTQGCQSMTFPQNSCLQLSGGGSAIAVCQPTQLLLTIYSSGDCSGSGQQDPQQINTCMADQSGTYLENICGGNSTAVVRTTGLLAQRKH